MIHFTQESGQVSYYFDGLREGWPVFDSRQGILGLRILLSNEKVKGGAFSVGVVLQLTTHFHLMPRSRMVELYLRYSIRFYGVMLN
jgi:hypothetical protein